MKMTRKILIAILLSIPMVAWGAVLEENIKKMQKTGNLTDLNSATLTAFNDLATQYKTKNQNKSTEIDNVINDAKKSINLSDTQPAQPNGTAAQPTEQPAETESAKSATNDSEPKTKSTATPEELQAKVDEAQKKLDAAKEKEQSFANRMLGGLSTAATGIGGMQLAQGIAEKRADSAADKDMDAYIATMRCTYGSDDKPVPFGVTPVELPGGNNADLMKYRAEYIALAADLKERKTALNLKPGIEAEEILDKATMGLYDDENVGITGGTYASRYRATTQNNEKDEKGLASDKKEAKTRMIAGGVVAGVGLVGGIVGNALINRNDDGSAKYDAFSNIQLANTDQAKRLIQIEYNDKNTSNTVDLNSCEKKSNVVISGRSQDTYTCKYKDSEEKIQFEFDDLSESSSITVGETLHDYFCVNKNSTATDCNNKVNKVMYNGN